MNVSVITLGGDEYKFEVAMEDTVEALKTLVEGVSGRSAREQRLLLGSIELRGVMTLVEAGVVDDTALTLVFQRACEWFQWSSQHADITITEDGLALVPRSSCHGGFPIGSSARFAVGERRWRLLYELVDQRDVGFSAGVAPCPDGGPPSLDRVIFTPDAPKGRSFRTQGMQVELTLDLGESAEESGDTARTAMLRWAILKPEDELLNGERSGSIELPAGEIWCPVIAMSHTVGVRLLREAI